MAGIQSRSRTCFVALATIGGLLTAACGGGAVENNTTPAVSYADYAAQDAQLQSMWGSEAATNPATLPGSGQAVYAGIMTLDAQVGPAVIPLAGTFAMMADFGASTISGQARDFRNSANQSYVGSLNMSNGRIDRAANPAVTDTFFADLNGSLAGGGQSLTISADLSGDFLGANALGTNGVVTGVASSGAGIGALFGSFIADQ